MEIKSLGYIGFGAKDPLEWLKFGTEILGMMPARAVPGESWGFPQDPNFKIASGGKGIADDGSVYLKLDDYQKTIISGHYSFSTPKFIEIKKKIANEIHSDILKLDLILKDEVKKSILRYVKDFNLAQL